MPKVQPAGAGSSRGGRGRRVATTLSEINVVPLVDVMLVLLIIFMVTAPMIQRGVDVKLPVARRANPIVGERVEVTVPLSYRQNHSVYLGTELVRADVLQERVRQKMETAVTRMLISHRMNRLRARFTAKLCCAVTICSDEVVSPAK